MTLRRISFFDGFQSETTPVTVVIADREFRVGSGAPSAGLGNDTDNYLDYDTGNIYLKTSGTWGLVGTINLLSVAQDFTVNGTLFATNHVDATNNVIAGGSVSAGTTISSVGDATIGGNLDVNGVGESNIAGNLTVEGDFTVNGTTTTVNSTTLDVTDSNITVNDGGDQATADLNDAGLTVEMSDATNALIHYDSTATTKWKIGEEGSTVEIADISSTQTITNKSFDSVNKLTSKEDTEANLITYALTADNGEFVYATDTKKYYGIEDGVLVEFGGGSGVGGINYIDNFDAEDNTDGWVTYADAAQEIPEDGTGGSPVVTFTRSETDPLREDASFVLSKDASDRQGQGVAYQFNIHNADKAKWLNINIDYSVTNDYQDGDIRFYIRDNTNSNIIRLSNENLLAIDSSLSGTFRSGFQTAPDSTDYSLIMHVATTNALAYDVKIDNVRVGPVNTSSVGSFISDWVDFTPSVSYGSGGATNVTHTGKYRRVGDSIEVEIQSLFSATSGSFSSPEYDLPNGLSFNTSDMAVGAINDKIGEVMAVNAGSNTYTGDVKLGNSSNSTIVNVHTSSGSSTGTFVALTNTFPFTFDSGDWIQVKFSAPIQGWETGISPNEVVSGRLHYAEGKGNDGSSITANVTNINWTTTRNDSGAWNGTTYKVPETGIYSITGQVFGTTPISGIFAYINGAQDIVVGFEGLADELVQINRDIYLETGQELTFRSDSSFTLSNDTSRHSISIRKNNNLSSQIQPTETVALKYITDSGQAIAASPTRTTVVYEDEVFDTHNVYNSSTGIFTCPIKGKYLVFASVETSSVAWSTADSISLDVFVNSINPSGIRNFFRIENGFTTVHLVQLGGLVELEVDDTLEVSVVSSKAFNLGTNLYRSYIHIVKVGN